MRDLDRNLGPFEHLLWLTDRWTPRHFAVAARLRGELDGPALGAALRRAQRRHPALRASIDAEPGACPRFVSGDYAEIPVRLCDRIVGDEWRTELVSELATPFDAHTAPVVALLGGDAVPGLLEHVLGRLGLSAARTDFAGISRAGRG